MPAPLEFAGSTSTAVTIGSGATSGEMLGIDDEALRLHRICVSMRRL